MFAVIGTFDENGGKPSKLAMRLVDGINEKTACIYTNGGNTNALETLVGIAAQHDVVLWMAHVPDNTLDKWVREIKKINKATVLVTSKRNIDNAYNSADIVHHGLLCRSNLMVEIFNIPNGRYGARVVDPLGNLWFESEDFFEVGKAVGDRVNTLRTFTRVGSESIGEAIPFPDIPERDEFCGIIRAHADTFKELVPAPKEMARFLGNASFRFRCTNGFPTIKANGKIFVTRRNISKSMLDGSGFVACEPSLWNMAAEQGQLLQYYGEGKPSVDTPVQIRLYNAMPEIRYCLHGHVYVKGAVLTESIVPCGAMEEVEEILAAVSYGLPGDKKNHVVNLRGHGFIAMGNDLEFLNSLVFERRIPEDGYEVCLAQ